MEGSEAKSLGYTVRYSKTYSKTQPPKRKQKDRKRGWGQSRRNRRKMRKKRKRRRRRRKRRKSIPSQSVLPILKHGHTPRGHLKKSFPPAPLPEAINCEVTLQHPYYNY